MAVKACTAALAVLFLVQGIQARHFPSRSVLQTNVEFPGGSVTTNPDGTTSVVYPGGTVNSGASGTQVTAPGTQVNVENTTSPAPGGSPTPGVDVSAPYAAMSVPPSSSSPVDVSVTTPGTTVNTSGRKLKNVAATFPSGSVAVSDPKDCGQLVQVSGWATVDVQNPNCGKQDSGNSDQGSSDSSTQASTDVSVSTPYADVQVSTPPGDASANAPSSQSGADVSVAASHADVQVSTPPTTADVSVSAPYTTMQASGH